jgi:hypothetical protein
LARTKKIVPSVVVWWWCVFFYKEISVCSQSGNHPYEDLAKSGYQPDIKHKSLITLLYFWLQIENKILKSGNFYLFCLTYGD